MTIGTTYKFLIDGVESEMLYYSVSNGHNFYRLIDGVRVESYTFSSKPVVGQGFTTSGKYFKRIN